MGPLAGLVGGLDLSYAVPFVVSGVLYRLLCAVWPEREATLTETTDPYPSREVP